MLAKFLNALQTGISREGRGKADLSCDRASGSTGDKLLPITRVTGAIADFQGGCSAAAVAHKHYLHSFWVTPLTMQGVFDAITAASGVCPNHPSAIAGFGQPEEIGVPK